MVRAEGQGSQTTREVVQEPAVSRSEGRKKGMWTVQSLVYLSYLFHYLFRLKLKHIKLKYVR